MKFWYGFGSVPRTNGSGSGRPKAYGSYSWYLNCHSTVQYSTVHCDGEKTRKEPVTFSVSVQLPMLRPVSRRDCHKIFFGFVGLDSDRVILQCIVNYNFPVMISTNHILMNCLQTCQHHTHTLDIKAPLHSYVVFSALLRDSAVPDQILFLWIRILIKIQSWFCA